MGDLILAAGLFTGEPVEEFIIYNQAEIDAQKARQRLAEETGEAFKETLVEPTGAYFSLLPVDGKLDAEYTKKRGQDKRNLKITPRQGDDDTGPEADFGVMDFEFSNERELAAQIWLAKKIVSGWRRVMLDSGTELEYSEHNLEKLASIPMFIRPVIERAYELGRIRDRFAEGNSETSSAGSAIPD
jgi:hypothetical protein